MDGACDDLFTGAALAADEHGGVAGRDLGDECLELPNVSAFADEAGVGVELLFEPEILGAQCVEGEYVFERDGGDVGGRLEKVDVIFVKWRSQGG